MPIIAVAKATVFCPGKYRKEKENHSAFPNFRTDRRFIFVQCKVKVLGKRLLNQVQE